MTYKVTIQPSGKTFPIKAEQSILDAALEAGIVLPYSCKNAACRTCKGKVVSGDYEAGNGTANLLEADEVNDGYALFCETMAQSDIVIESKEIQVLSDVVVKKMPTRVIEIEERAEDVKIIKLQLPGNEPFKYKAGQYIDFILRQNKRRSYSVANAPGEGGTVELHIRHLPGGLFTDHVFGAGETSMKVREILRMEGPLGSFFLRQDSDKPIIFLATGTGFAPIKAMMEEIIMKNITRPIHFYWGARRPKGLYMDDLVQQWNKDLPFFNYIPVCSAPAQEDNWEGRVGHVQNMVAEDFDDLSNYEVYACGNPQMTLDAQTVLCESRKLPEDQFFADAFTSEADKPENQ